ncbi:MAG: trypsin-like peptidase domain-containing protein [Caldisericia bacterium]|nr:trypsin-like peptidase domain-containing protein [Caldisericia bacterium]HOJ15778.1 trypsin-like peptidase domain-containing protein [Caldisericia bacterium]HPO28771.1 trypsin-like peptidase domain-containing protein [Caldisericia bacterium]HXK69915.1 trypsin-like peptidase domain-containing protein [Caldisericia bacterium]
MEDFKDKRRSNSFVAVIVALIIFVIGGFAGGAFSTYWLVSKPSFLPEPPINLEAQTQTPSTSSAPISISSNIETYELIPIIAEKASNAVVKIDISKVSYGRIVSSGFGSGFIVSEDGYILTNNHVVEGANTIKVTLKNGKKYDGKVVGTDSLSDIAVITINAKKLPTLTLGDSDKARVGETVIAIGNPLGYDYTVTVGVISGIQREITPPSSSETPELPFPFFFPYLETEQTATTPMVGVIQTDAPINPGNSGGPLINLKGEVVGINFMIESDAQGLGFAVSSNVAKKVMNEIIEYGTVSWPSLGVVITENNEAVANELNLKTDKGIVVVEVPEGSARKAGIKKNDVIISVDGKEIVKSEDLIAYIRSKKVGDIVTLTIDRSGKKMDVKVQLGELKR